MSPNKKYIFLVEDDDELRSDLERALQFCGYTIFTFANPEQFLSEFKPLVPAVLVTDMRMPKLSGVQLQSELIAKGHKIPIIFISAPQLLGASHAKPWCDSYPQNCLELAANCNVGSCCRELIHHHQSQ